MGCALRGYCIIVPYPSLIERAESWTAGFKAGRAILIAIRRVPRIVIDLCAAYTRTLNKEDGDEGIIDRGLDATLLW
jgi:hypothetical protein